MRIAWLFAALFAVAAASDEEKDRPIARVVAMLRKMSREMQEDMERDQEIFDKMDCWCRVNKKGKEAAVVEAKRRIGEQEAFIEEAVAKKASLEVQQKNLEKDVAESEEALKEQDAMRRKASEEFHEKHKDLLRSIEQLKNALKVLGRHNSLLIQQKVKAVIRHIVWKHGDLLKAEHRHVLGGFVQMPVYGGGHNAASGEIFGILTNMLDNMEAELEDAKKSDATGAANYDEWKAAELAQLNAAKANLDQVKSDFAKFTEDLRNTKKDNEDTMAAMEADNQFLADLVLKCQAKDNDWEERKKLRLEEMSAVSDAIKILSDDDARDLFDKTHNKESMTALVQIRSHSAVRSKVSNMLMAVARRNGSTSLAQVAAKVQLDAFKKIKKAVKELIVDLKKDGLADVKHKDWCQENLTENAKVIKETNFQREDHETNIADLENQVERLTQEIVEHQATIADNNKQLKQAGENREAENKEFKTMVQNQQNAQLVLNKASDRLAKFYDKQKSFAQQEPGAKVEAMPHGFDKYATHQGSNAVLMLLKNAIEESETTVTEGTNEENSAQKEYESFVSDMTSSNEEQQAAIRDKTGEKAQSETNKVEAQGDLKTTVDDLESLAKQAADLHQSCDFLIKNFDIRAGARNDEIEALQQGLSVLNGADLGSGVVAE